MATPKLALVESNPTEFVCPDCLSWQRFETGEEIQHCRTCNAFHKSVVLVADNWMVSL